MLIIIKIKEHEYKKEVIKKNNNEDLIFKLINNI